MARSSRELQPRTHAPDGRNELPSRKLPERSSSPRLPACFPASTLDRGGAPGGRARHGRAARGFAGSGSIRQQHQHPPAAPAAPAARAADACSRSVAAAAQPQWCLGHHATRAATCSARHARAPALPTSSSDVELQNAARKEANGHGIFCSLHGAQFCTCTVSWVNFGSRASPGGTVLVTVTSLSVRGRCAPRHFATACTRAARRQLRPQSGSNLPRCGDRPLSHHPSRSALPSPMVTQKVGSRVGQTHRRSRPAVSPPQQRIGDRARRLALRPIVLSALQAVGTRAAMLAIT